MQLLQSKYEAMFFKYFQVLLPDKLVIFNIFYYGRKIKFQMSREKCFLTERNKYYIYLVASNNLSHPKLKVVVFTADNVRLRN